MTETRARRHIELTTEELERMRGLLKAQGWSGTDTDLIGASEEERAEAEEHPCHTLAAKLLAEGR